MQEAIVFNRRILRRRQIKDITQSTLSLVPRPGYRLTEHDRYNPTRNDQFISYNLPRRLPQRTPQLTAQINSHEEENGKNVDQNIYYNVVQSRRPLGPAPFIIDPNTPIDSIYEQPDNIVPSAVSVPLPPPSARLCDFCLGSSLNNPRTNKAELLICCSECDRAAHPSCLQFDERLLQAASLYPWQCMECKRCSICDLADNDAQLLFCDRCDRGYHIYCLTPPLSKPPDGEWHCELCIE